MFNCNYIFDRLRTQVQRIYNYNYNKYYSHLHILLNHFRITKNPGANKIIQFDTPIYS